MNKRNLLRALGLTVMLWGVGVFAMNTTSGASCATGAGFSGFMHKALFAPTANCAVNTKTGSCSSAGANCTYSTALSGQGKQGHCTVVTNGCKCQ